MLWKLIMSIPKNGMMICNNPKCKDVETKLKEEFAQVVVIEALEERDYSVIEKIEETNNRCLRVPRVWGL